MTKKYEINAEGRVVALRDFGDVKVGDVGGFLESEKNLSHEGDCWIYGDAWVFGNAQICKNAKVFENAWVYGDAKVFENAWVCGDARVCGDAWVFGNTRVYGNAQVYENAKVFGNAQVSVNAQVYGNARVYGNAQVYGNAWVYGNAQVYGNARVYGNAEGPTMTRDDIIRMAREAGIDRHGFGWTQLERFAVLVISQHVKETRPEVADSMATWLQKIAYQHGGIGDLSRTEIEFGAMVAAAEREACAKVVENYCGAWDDKGYALTQAIRATGEK